MPQVTNPETTVRQGVNLARFVAFQKFADQNPNEVSFEFEAEGTYEGRALHTKATTGPYTVGDRRIARTAREYTYHLGAHQEVEAALGIEAPADREEPLEVALAALTACVNSVVATSALVRGLELSFLKTAVRVAWNPRVFLNLESPERDGKAVDQFGDLRIELAVGGDDLDAADIEYLRESVKRSAVFNLMTQAHANNAEIREVHPLRETGDTK